MRRSIYVRALAPRWSYEPLSGQGANLFGGRFNRPGQAALYLAGDAETALAEYQQAVPHKSATLCYFEIEGGKVADARRNKKISDPHVLRCAWLEIWRHRSETPPSWLLSERLADQGYHGMIYPSVRRPEGKNLVLWQWNEEGAPQVMVLDPAGDLPRNQRSWQSGE